jgi:NADPH-dependent 2,4-dienoyl-CoA reductase/sulfur reductase-like enzyme
MNKIVIVGGGHAAAQLCGALAEAGLGSRVHLVCAEESLPYQRPPLSKAFLKSPTEALQLQRAESWYAQAGITVHLADPVLAIDRAARQLRLQDQQVLDGVVEAADGRRDGARRPRPHAAAAAFGLANVGQLLEPRVEEALAHAVEAARLREPHELARDVVHELRGARALARRGAREARAGHHHAERVQRLGVALERVAHHAL